MDDLDHKPAIPLPSRRRAACALGTVMLVLTAATACEAMPDESGDAPVAQTPPPGPGEVWSVGLNSDGQLGRPKGDLDVALGPARGTGGADRLRGIVAIAAGSRHSLALTSDGRVLAWGANGNGQLGTGAKHATYLPGFVRAPDDQPGYLRDVVAIAASEALSMALRRNGTVVTWGAGGQGQRGIGRRAAPPTPTTVRGPDGKGPLTGVVGIAAAPHNGLAILADGAVVAWGSNKAGMLGDGTRRNRTLPVYVRGPGGKGRLDNVAQISTGHRHVVARMRDGQLMAWGLNDRGQLGDGTRRSRALPAPVAGVKGGVLGDVIDLASGGKHNYALLRNGTVAAWGDNRNGQLGIGSTADSPRPVTVAGTYTSVLRGVGAVGAGRGFGVAVLAGGSALTWGGAGKGQLGSGNRVARSRPGPLIAARGESPGAITDVAAGDRHLLLLTRPSGTG